jgi:hypothetical protein
LRDFCYLVCAALASGGLMRGRRELAGYGCPNRIRDTIEDKNALLRFLRDNPIERFSASDLKNRTGVPKSRVRDLIGGESDVQTSTVGAKTFYQIKPAQSVGAAVA